jgi:hypothetical protein
MKDHDFQRQIARIESQFGKFGTERARLLWREVKEFSAEWMEQTIDRLLSESRQIPLPSDFREDISRERERLWKLEKQKNEKDAKEFFHGTYDAEDTRTICQYIVKRISGGVSDEDYSNFIKHLSEAGRPLKPEKQECITCHDSGYVFVTNEENYTFTYRCYCEIGKAKAPSYPVFQPALHKKGE